VTIPTAEIVKGGELAEIAAGAGLGLAVIAAFAVGLLAAIRSSESRARGRAGLSVMLAALGTIAFAGAVAGGVYGLVVIISDGPLG
jgi:hypothetical protein